MAANWGETTSMVTSLSESLNTAMTNGNNAMAGLTLTEDAVAKLDEGKATAYNDAKTAVMNAIGGFIPIQKEVGEVMKTWTEKTDVLNALQEGLAAGKLGPDSRDQINALNGMVSKLTESVGTGKEQAGAQQAGLDSSLEKLKAVYAMVTGK